MKRVINLIKQVLEFPVIWVGILYLFWLIFVPMDESYILGVILFGIYLIITILEKLSSKNRAFSLILLFIFLPIACEASILTFWLLTGWLNRGFIFIMLIILFASYPAFSVFQNASGKNKALSILLFMVTLPILAINIIYFVSYFPEVIDKTEFGNFRYYIASGLDMDYHSHLTFYKCKKWSPICTSLYRTYDRQDFDKIIIDQEKDEVSAISSDPYSRLVYTDGKHSRLYEGYPMQLDDHVYQISTDYDFGTCGSSSCDVYIYRLYECKLDYTSCNPLPMQHIEGYDVALVLDASKTTNEINAYDNYDNTPIFTYGEHPICYVKGCSILDQK